MRTTTTTTTTTQGLRAAVLSGALAFTARAVGWPALGSGIRPEAPLEPSLATFDRPAADTWKPDR